MEPVIRDWFTFNLDKIFNKFDLKYKIKLRIIDKKMPTLEGLIKEFNILIHLITFEGGKNAHFRIRQYSDIIKIMKNYPESNLDSSDKILKFLISKGKKNPKKIMVRVKEYIDTGVIMDAQNALKNPQVRAIIELTKIYKITTYIPIYESF